MSPITDPYKHKGNEVKMHHAKIILCLLVLIFLNVQFSACSKRQSIEGIYVHYKEIQKYYTLSIDKDNDSAYEIKLEGVPLDALKTAPWSKKCKGELSGNTIQCDDVKLFFSSNYETISVTYPSNEVQIFISDKKSIEEDITIFENKIK
jgi:hypothetical protein